MITENGQSSDSPRRVTVWRVRTLSCDGGLPGREWSAEFFMDRRVAESRIRELIAQSDERNPNYPFREQQEDLDGVVGFCNWQFGTMLTLDAVEVK